MSANRSANPSNESPASSVSSVHEEDKEAPPCFVSVEPPSFGSIVITHDPPSFALSTTLEEVTQQHPPVSPGTATRIFDHAWRNHVPRNEPLSAEEAEDFLLENDDLNTTVRATAYGLISTIHHRTTQYSHNMQQAEQRIRKQRHIVEQ